MAGNVWLHKRNGTLSALPSSHNRFKCFIVESDINELVCRRLDRGLSGVNVSDAITGLYCSGPDGDAPFRRGFLGHSADGGSLLIHSPLK